MKLSTLRHALTMGVALFPAVVLAQSDAPVKADQSAMGEIVVTAQRRAENLQNVPLSVAAITPTQLQASGANAVQDLTNATTGLVWARTTSVGQPTIRGIGTRNTAAGDEPNVATYLDGVYQPDAFGTIYELANLERIEVLKGPQVTLFGRNATGGAINIVTKKPAFTPEGEATFTYGRYNYVKGTAYVTGPIVADRVAASVSAVGLRDDGYIRNIYLNKDQGKRELAAVRSKVLFTPSDTTEFQLGGYYSWSKDDTTFSTHPVNGNTNVRLLVNNAAANPAGLPLNVLVPTGDFETSLNDAPHFKANQYMVDGRFSHDLGFATLSGLAAYQKTKNNYKQDFDYSPLAQTLIQIAWRAHSTYEELLLTSNGDGRFKWIIGANALQAKAFMSPQNTNNNRTFNGQWTRSASGFGEGTYEMVDDLFLTAGIRYSWDQKRTFRQFLSAANVLSGIDRGKASWTDWSPRAVVRYQFAPNSNVYASYTQGFKSGTFNPLTTLGATVPAKPENVDSYEIGLKSDLTSNVRLNLAAFHYDYTNLQVTLFTNVNGAVVSILQNAPKAKVNGWEASAEFAVTSDLRLNAGVSYLDAKIKNFPNAVVTIPNPAAPPFSGNASVSRDVAGRKLPRAPQWTGNIGATYTTALANGELTVNGTMYFTTKWFLDTLNRVQSPGYQLVNASVSWQTPDQHWKFTVFGQNLTDARYYATVLSFAGNDNFAYAKPRWFGATVGYNF